MSEHEPLLPRPPLEAPPPELSCADRPGCDPRLFELAPLAQVSREIGVAIRTLQRWAKATDDAYKPAMPHVKRGRAIYAKPIVAYEHLKTYAARSRGLRPPAGYVEPAEAGRAMIAKASEVAAKAGMESPREFLLSFINGDRDAPAPQIQAYVAVVNSLVRAAEVESKNAKRYDIRDLLETAEDVRDAFIKGMDRLTVRASLRLRNVLAEHFGVKLSAFANAQAILQNALVDEAETLATWFRDQIKTQIQNREAKDIQ